MTRLAVLGLPLCKIEDVVAAVVRSSADEAFNGNTLSIDAKCVSLSLSSLLGCL